ncbi:MAG: hypothetical protein J6A25_14380 [Lachnospiraceae bacterium]|nr:hypothetical protein [Lachnospiraceae bacterium]
METIFTKLLYMSVQASITIGVILVARLIFKLIKAPKRYSYILWLIPFIRLICPLVLESDFSLMPRVFMEYEIENNGNSEAIENNYNTYYDVVDETGQETYDNTYYTYESNSIKDTIEYPSYYNIDELEQEGLMVENGLVSKKGNVVEKKTASISLISVMSYIWIAGVALIVVYSAISFLRFKKKLVGGVAIEKMVYLMDYIDTAFVIGVLRPRIYVPSNIDEDELEYVIAHEKQHIKGLDYIIKPIVFFIVSIHWFNPIVWMAYYFFEKDMEMSCDEAVIGKLGIDKKESYATALLKLSAGKNYLLSIPTAFAEGSTKGRVKNIMKAKKPIIAVVVIAIVVVIILSVALLTNPAEKDKGGSNNTSTSTNMDSQSTDEKVLLPGVYSLDIECNEVNDSIEDNQLSGKYIPQLRIDENGSVGFGYDPFSSYLVYASSYTVEDGVMSFTTDDGNRTYTFLVQDDHTLIFDAENSSTASCVDGNAAYKVTDGATFTWGLYEYAVEGVTYTSEIEYQEAYITEDMILGSDGVILDYVDSHKIIFHGYAGLFVYNLDEIAMESSVNLEPIGCNYTQGDNACKVSVSDDGRYVYMVLGNKSGSGESYIDGTSTHLGDLDPNSSTYVGDVVYRYDTITEELLCGPTYELMPEDSYSSFDGLVSSSEYIEGVNSGSGYYSSDCVEVSDGVYGYLYCSTGMWKDIVYVESDMVFMMYDKEK